MKRIVAIALMSGIYALCPAATLSAAEVLASIQHSGAKVTIAELERRDQWQMVTDMISTGDSGWIELVPKLAVASDEAATEDLAISLSVALPKNAPFVLAVLAIEHTINASRVCSMPFSEDRVKDRSAYKRQTQHALDEVKDASLAQTKANCIATLKRAE